VRRRRCLQVLAGAAAVGLQPIPGAGQSASLTPSPIFALRNPGCTCCEGWARHLRENGLEVQLHDSPALDEVKRRLGVPEDLESCHTAIVEGYRVEGHVPAPFIKKLLEEKPAVLGIAVAGMPIGSPGMEGPNPQPYEVIAFGGQSPNERFVFGKVTS
jgi:hypothetical protein